MTDEPGRRIPEPLRIETQTLRALAHPARVRIVWELATVASARTSDLAAAMGEPANKVSYHLKTLAEHGVIVRAEPPASSTDGREAWWRLASEAGVTWDSSDPAVDAAAAEIQRTSSEFRNALEQHSNRINRDQAWPTMGAGFNALLTRAEAERFRNRLFDLVEELFELRLARLGTDADHDVEYFLDLGYFPIAIRHRAPEADAEG